MTIFEVGLKIEVTSVTILRAFFHLRKDFKLFYELLFVLEHKNMDSDRDWDILICARFFLILTNVLNLLELILASYSFTGILQERWPHLVVTVSQGQSMSISFFLQFHMISKYFAQRVLSRILKCQQNEY